MILKRSLLLPSEEIWLNHDDEGEAFIRTFRECWRQIPGSDSKRIIDYWKNSGIDSMPMIELSTLWSDSQSNYGQVRLGGMQIRFDSSSFRLFPKGVARWVIAHELAHVFQKAEGKPPGGDEVSRNEVDADDIVVRWGFGKTAWSLLRHNLSSGKPLEKACLLIKKTLKE